MSGWVYRDGRRRENGAPLVAELAAAVVLTSGLRGEARRKAAVETLVVAGTLEAALADAAHRSAPYAARVTDHLAALALGYAPREDVCVAGLDVPPELWISAPEGFAYYALHPEAYARAIASIDASRVLVVGVRSIGTTLSAVAREAFARRGIVASRLTVRPHGPPHDRRLVPSGAEAEALTAAARDGAHVVVADEGPGMSGSTFLAVAEAAVRAGVPAERIVLACSHDPDVAALAAPDAAARFSRFRRVVASDVLAAPGREVSAGAWRAEVHGEPREWPASWIATERRKWRAGDRLVKFEGLGRSGAAVRARLEALADAGFAPPPRAEGDGLVSTPWLEGPRLREDDRGALDAIARYCAARPTLCPARGEPEDLLPVVAKNLAVLGLGRSPLPLHVERPCICDGRMLPHEWQRTEGGLVKHDGASHGDDHFFPGPTDVAWDLAGTIVEWRLSRAEADLLLERYARASGDDARRRIGPWIVAYVACRGAWLLGATQANEGAERDRLARALARHREVGGGWLASVC